MAELDSITILAAFCAASLLSGFLSGSIGFASGIIPTALLVLVVATRAAVPLLAPIVLVGAAIALAFHWGRWQGRHVLILTPPLLVGTWVGAIFLSSAPKTLINIALAGLVITIGSIELASRAIEPGRNHTRLRKVIAHPAAGMLIGFVSGITSAVAHAGGVVVTGYLLAAGVEKRHFPGTILAVLVIADAWKLLAFLQQRLFTSEMIVPLAWGIPIAIIGAALGRAVYIRIPASRFRQVIACTLIATGVLMIVV